MSKKTHRPKAYYMHLLEGRPAYFDGNQIVFLNGSYNRVRQPLRKSLAEIRADQKATFDWRRAQGFTVVFPTVHYVIVRV